MTDSFSASSQDRKSGKGCWYKVYITECPLCGAGHETRERQYTPAPDSYDWRARVEITTEACVSHFL